MVMGIKVGVVYLSHLQLCMFEIFSSTSASIYFHSQPGYNVTISSQEMFFVFVISFAYLFIARLQVIEYSQIFGISVMVTKN